MPQSRIMKSEGQRDSSLYVCAPLNALVAGIYEENIHLDEIINHGDFGIGTFDDLDGEMVIVDRAVYQLATDGCAIKIAEPIMTPYAAVTFFNPTIQADLDHETQYIRFLEWLNDLLPSPNIFYAIRIDGDFPVSGHTPCPGRQTTAPWLKSRPNREASVSKTSRGRWQGYTPPTSCHLSVFRGIIFIFCPRISNQEGTSFPAPHAGLAQEFNSSTGWSSTCR
jgi:acetolactate decarboxylase